MDNPSLVSNGEHGAECQGKCNVARPHLRSVSLKREIEIVQLHLQRRKKEREGESDGRNIASVSPPEMHDDDFMQKGGTKGAGAAPAYLRNGPNSTRAAIVRNLEDGCGECRVLLMRVIYLHKS